MTEEDEAFILLNEGKVALSPEVKAFKLKSKRHSTFIDNLRGS